MNLNRKPIGDHLREWRQRRRMSQLALACEAEISQKHLSFIETGRAMPSREMVLHLSAELNVPMRSRNLMLMAAGFAPAYSTHAFQDQALNPVRRAVSLILDAMEPYPALAIDRHWNSIRSNHAARILTSDAADFLLKPPVNVLRLSLHPQGLAPRIVNFRQWRELLLKRLAKEVESTGDAVLEALLDELLCYPTKAPAASPGINGSNTQGGGLEGVTVPLKIMYQGELLSLVSTTTVFGTAADVTVSELALESFLPTDAITAERLRNINWATTQGASNEQLSNKQNRQGD